MSVGRVGDSRGRDPNTQILKGKVVFFDAKEVTDVVFSSSGSMLGEVNVRLGKVDLQVREFSKGIENIF